MAREDWIWMPHPGHFICASNCQYHLNTMVNGYILSTVGEYFPDRDVRKTLAEMKYKFGQITEDIFEMLISKKGDEYDFYYRKHIGFEEIGFNRTYETMVFPAVKCLEGEGANCCPWRQKSGESIEVFGYNTPDEATIGHYKACEKFDKEPYGGTTDES